MEDNKIIVIYHPSAEGYSAYAQDYDGINAQGETLQQAEEKILQLLSVRAGQLTEIGETEAAQKLRSGQVVFVEE